MNFKLILGGALVGAVLFAAGSWFGLSLTTENVQYITNEGAQLGALTTNFPNGISAGTSTFTGFILSGSGSCVSATWNPAAVIGGNGGTGNVNTTSTLTGATLGDKVISSIDLDTQGLILSSWVSAANSIKTTLYSMSTSSVDIATTTLKSCIIR